jgi:hypothetical protein
MLHAVFLQLWDTFSQKTLKNELDRYCTEGLLDF